MKTLITMTLALALLTAGGCGDIPNHLGLAGKDGKDGAQGNAGTNGADGATGAQGAQGEKGDKGDIGETGAQGVAGNNGQNGADGTQITVVQLCGSCVGAYPAVFPEIGLCMGGKLFGVYSANGGFLVEINNGAYNSQGINCSCSFTVNGCTVN